MVLLTVVGCGTSRGAMLNSSVGSSGGSSAYQVNLTWIAPPAGDDPPVSYNVFRRTSSTTFLQINAVPITDLSFSDKFVDYGETYDYQLESVDAAGNPSVPSDVIAVTIPQS